MQEGSIRAVLLNNDERIDRLVFIKVAKARNTAKNLLQVLVFPFDQARIAESSLFEGLEHSFFRNPVERDGRATRDNRAALFYDFAQRVFVVRPVTRQSYRHKIVLLVVADEVQHQREFLAFVFAQATAKLLDEHDG